MHRFILLYKLIFFLQQQRMFLLTVFLYMSFFYSVIEENSIFM